MDIRFCDRCSESIPDSDFEAGRAVTVDGKHLHVGCALSRALALTGPRSWMTFLLALYAAAVVTFLLFAVLGKEEPVDVNDAVAQRILDTAVKVKGEVTGERDAAIAAYREEVGASLAKAANTLRAESGEELAALGKRIDQTDKLASDRLSTLQGKVQGVEEEIGNLSTLIRETLERAEAEASRRAEPPVPVQPPVTPEPVQPTPMEPTPPATDPAHDAEVARWIARLEDSNENIRFSATLELGRLKDLRAAAPLIDVLKGDRDYYVRLGAATALGDMKACDAVAALVEALDDKDTLVRTAANDALQAVTGQAFEFVTEMSGRERRKVMKQWRDWWKSNETGVRGRLGQ